MTGVVAVAARLARRRLSASYDYATGDVPYPMHVAVTTHIRWRIRVVS